MIEAGHDLKTTSYPLWTIDDETITGSSTKAASSHRKARGSVIMFNSDLVHGSPSNMSPYDRTIVYLSLCHVDNHIRRFKRAEWIAHQDFKPIECLPDGASKPKARSRRNDPIDTSSPRQVENT